jgi:hypothetical protein
LLPASGRWWPAVGAWTRSRWFLRFAEVENRYDAAVTALNHSA